MGCRPPVSLACTYEDVKREVDDIELRGPDLNIDRIGRFLVAMRNLEVAAVHLSNLISGDRFTLSMQSIEEAVQFPDTAKFMSCIWGLVRFVLQTTKDTEAFNDVLDVYEKLGHHMPLLGQHEQIFKDHSESDICLAYIYTDVQTFHRCAHTLISLRTEGELRPRSLEAESTCSLARSRPSRVTGNLWGCIFDRIAKSLNIHRWFIQNINVDGLPDDQFADIYEEYLERRKDCRKYQSESKQTKEQVTTWISASKKTPLLHKLLQNMRECCGDDLKLMKGCDEVTGRMKSEGQPFDSVILLSSKGGYSKTILASRIIDELTKHTTKTYYFYCQKEDPERRTCFDILKGILQQMVDVNKDLESFCIEQARLASNTNVADAETLEDLLELFVGFGAAQFIIIDGLDECEPGEAPKIATYFRRLAAVCNEMKQGQVRVLFMGRPMVVEGVVPRDIISVELNNEANSVAYIEERIPELCDAFNLYPDNGRGSQIKDDIRRLTQDMPPYFTTLGFAHLLQQGTTQAFLKALTGFHHMDSLPLPFLKRCAEGYANNQIAPLLPKKTKRDRTSTPSRASYPARKRR